MTRAMQRQAWRKFNKMLPKKDRCTFREYPVELVRYHAATRIGVKYERPTVNP